MKKGIAVETLAKFLIAIIALAILVYLIFRYVLGSGLSERECAARMTAWCVQCQMANKGVKPWGAPGLNMGEDLGSCVSEYWGFGSEGQECNGFDDECGAFLPSTD